MAPWATVVHDKANVRIGSAPTRGATFKHCLDATSRHTYLSILYGGVLSSTLVTNIFNTLTQRRSWIGEGKRRVFSAHFPNAKDPSICSIQPLPSSVQPWEHRRSEYAHSLKPFVHSTQPKDHPRSDLGVVTRDAAISRRLGQTC